MGMGKPDESNKFKKLMQIDFPMICDPGQGIYSAYHLRRTSTMQMLSPALISKGLKLMSKGYKLEFPRHDAAQLAGVFVIDTRGEVRWCYYSADPSDHPSVDAIINSA